MTSEVSHKSALTDAPKVSLPWLRVLVVTSLTALATSALWIALAPRWGWEGSPIAVRAIVTVVPVAVLGWLVTAPWKPRTILDWMTAWLVGTVIRFLLTPAAAAAVYFSAPCDTRQFIAALGACYFASLLAEVATIATALSDCGRQP
ncbi:MAG: hypothetical protein EXS03_02345 [Phycisphaerales bacterium]|nr:hypothetical protein [Phycisphaerales bacterium]